MVTALLWRAAATSYALLYLFLFLLLKVTDGSIFRITSASAKKQLAIARNKFWKTDGNPEGLSHEFFVLSNGMKLHYVIKNPSRGQKSRANLVIFLHGFPDSWMLWRGFLKSKKLSEESVLIAVDLPGYGGSDGLPDYGATAILETITAFILGMREEHLSNSGDDVLTQHRRVLVVSHDWGSLIAYRLAAEAPLLADRFIVSNSVLPDLAKANIICRWSCASQMLRDWRHQPRSVKLARMAASNLAPVLKQLGRSGYIFVINYLRPLIDLGGSFGDYLFLRIAFDSAAGHKVSPESMEAAEALASSLGPSIQECTSEGSYSEVVKKRAVRGPWSEQIRIYREGLSTRRWKKSLETLMSLRELERGGTRRRSNSGAGIFDTGPKGALQAPTTVVWGALDPVLDIRITLAGIRDYFCRGSQVVMLPQCGHWVPLNDTGQAILEEVVSWAASGEKVPLSERIAATGFDAVVTAEK